MENKEFVYVLTHSYDTIERASAALQLATNMATFDSKIDFFLINESVHLARKVCRVRHVAERFFACAELMKSLVEDFDCNFYICAPALNHMVLKERTG